jgi:hypothetical protein
MATAVPMPNLVAARDASRASRGLFGVVLIELSLDVLALQELGEALLAVPDADEFHPTTVLTHMLFK